MAPADTEFVHRLETALSRAPGVPERSHGRMTWLMREVQRQSGEHLTLESVRRWFLGRNKPAGANLQALCNVLQCDPAWLLFGSAPVGTRLEQVRGSGRADGAVYLALGRMLLDGVSAALPSEGDELARSAAIDLEAIIGRQSRRFTVSQAEQSMSAEDQAAGVLVARPRMPSTSNEHILVVPSANGQHAVYHVPGHVARQVVEPRLNHGEIRLRTVQPGRIALERAASAEGGEGDALELNELKSFATIGPL